MNNSSITAVVRNFQGGTTFDSFDTEKCDKGLISPLNKLLRTSPEQLHSIVIVSCGEEGSKYSEETKGGLTPTLNYVGKMFPQEVGSGKIILENCTDWGLNAGSGNALNAGLRIATEQESDKVLMWSPQIDLNGHMLYLMLYHMEQFGLDLVGYARNRWYHRIQWQFAQNTCALWNTDVLKSIDGFSPVCNGDGKTTVNTIEYGDVPLAGMEDIEAYFRASKKAQRFLSWGNVGTKNPVYWDQALKVPGTVEYNNNLQKIARQGLVMEEYAKMIFPELEQLDVFDKTFAACTYG